MARTQDAANATVFTNPYKMPGAPLVYLNDPTPTLRITNELIKLLPSPLVAPIFLGIAELDVEQSRSYTGQGIRIVRDSRRDNEYELVKKLEVIRALKAAAINTGVNFVSINIVNDPAKLGSCDSLDNSNHLSIVSDRNTAQKIYKWLFTVLTIPETLYLIPDDDMKKINTRLFPSYEYSTIDGSRNKPKNANIQFVALVLTKPQVVDGKKLVWMVADKTGVGHFYFRFRGESSQYTWDWVTNLKPGDLRAFPRMSMLQIKERNRVTIVKAPFRGIAAVIGGTGFAFKKVGRGLDKAGTLLKMGSRTGWVPEADVDGNGKKTDCIQKTKQTAKLDNSEPTEANQNEAEKTWDDGASDASTEAGSDRFDNKMINLV